MSTTVYSTLAVSAVLLVLGAFRSDRKKRQNERVQIRPGLVMRRLQVGDNQRGFFELLNQLTTATKVPQTVYRARFRHLQRRGEYCIIVVEDTVSRRIVGSATLLVEFKFIRGCGLVGHIEDVVVDAAYRGQRLGQLLVQQLVDVAKTLSCYKVILDCADDKMGFYNSCEFERKGMMMAHYF
jgi:glucosamine-phosphate N-acetyltransferase